MSWISVHHVGGLEQAQAESLVRICWGILHVQYLCSDFLGDTTCRFWCQYVTPYCCSCPYCLLLPCQVFFSSLWPSSCHFPLHHDYALFVSVVDSYSVCFSFRVGGVKQIAIHIWRRQGLLIFPFCYNCPGCDGTGLHVWVQWC